ncbi:MAG: OB-fold nucleic acid binding domain-containing protein [Synergistaceae bacterium]|nr:OB-fold nucleic acid binding domain-containing protein [Synergistaceae bacterium]
MNFENSVILSGLLHHLGRKKNDTHFSFSVRHENLWTDGTTRKDFLSARVFNPELQERIKALAENTPVRVKGQLRTSKGSGELFVAVSEVEVLDEKFELENSVKLSGFVHVIKAQNEGETGTGKYVRFAVRQEIPDEHGHARKDFLVVRVFNDALKEILAGKKSDDPVEVEGTMRSSKGSGVNYVMCSGIK